MDGLSLLFMVGGGIVATLIALLIVVVIPGQNIVLAAILGYVFGTAGAVAGLVISDHI